MLAEISLTGHDIDGIRKSYPPEDGVLLGVDVDNSGLWTSKPATKRYCSLTGKSYSDDRIKEVVDGFGCFGRDLHRMGCNLKEAVEIENGIWNDRDVQLNAPPALGAREILETFADAHLGFCFVTSRPPKNLEWTYDSLEKWFPFIDLDHQVLIRKNNSISGSRFKIRKVQRLRPFFFVEDSLGDTRKIISHCPETQVLWFPYPLGLKQPDLFGMRGTGRLHQLAKTQNGSPNFWNVGKFIRDSLRQ